MIFNDPAFPRQMRVCRPDGQVKKLESGSLVALPLVPLAPNKWHTIRWRITEKKMEIWVNDIQVFIEKRNYDLGVEQAVRVRAMDSVLDLKSLEVKRLQ